MSPSLLFRKTVLAAAAVVFVTAGPGVSGASADNNKFFLPPPPPLPGSAFAYDVAKDLHEKAVNAVGSVLPLPGLPAFASLVREANRPLEYLVGIANRIVPFQGSAAGIDLPSRCP